MKFYFLITIAILSQVCSAQNVYIESADHIQKINNIEFATFQFVDASYSRSRATLPIITTKDIYLGLVNAIPKLRGKKKEYTDYWILGIKNFDSENVTDENKITIDEFYKQIRKYRADNNLPPYAKDQLELVTAMVSEKSKICKYLSCKLLNL